MFPSLLSLSLTGAALAAVLGLILLAGRLVRAGGLAPRAGAARRIHIRETVALDQRRRLHLVSCQGRDLLLLTGGGNDMVIGWLSPAGPEQTP